MDRSTEELLEVIQLSERISTDLHDLSEEQEIIETVTGAFRLSKRFHAHVMMADEARKRLKFVATSFAPTLVKLGETIAGVSMRTFEVDPTEAQPLGRVYLDGETLLISTIDALQAFLPSRVVPTILKRLKYEGTRDILTPLYRNGRVSGILSITAPGLAEPFIPSMKNLAHHISAALAFADSHSERQRAERRYQDLIESLNEIFYTVDVEGRFTYVSPNVTAMGFTQEDLLGVRFDDFFEGEQLGAIRERFGQYLSGEATSGQSTYHIRPKGGELRWIRISSRVMLENGRPAGLRGSIADVTDEVTGQQALAESERILKQTGRMAQIGGWEHDLGTGEAVWTEELYRIIELEPETQPPGVDEHLSYYPSSDRARLEEAYARAVQEGKPFDLELQVHTATGRLIWCRVYGEPVLEGETCVKTRGTFQDITLRKRAELAREETERRLATLMSNLPGMVYRCRNDREWTMEFVNDGSQELTGYAPKDLMENRAVSYGSLIHPDDQPSVWKGVQAALAAGQPFQLEYRIRTADGAEKWVWEQGQGVFSEDREVVAIEGFITDVTQRVTYEHAIEAALSGTIRAVARTVELRDPYTAGHQERVASLACAIAVELGGCDDLIPGLRVAGLLHDVGKVAVPSEILAKPSRLREAEMKLARGHVEASHRILEGIPFPWPIAELVRDHHERLDGSGYPRGLKGDAVGQGARILAVADTVEAMSSHRPYRPALSLDEALAEIERGRGAQYDTDVVDACLRLFREKGLTLDDLANALCPTEREGAWAAGEAE